MPASSRPTVVVFEDDKKRRRKIVTELGKLLRASFKVVAFLPKANAESGPFEDRLVRELVEQRLQDSILFVSDRDLSRIEAYTGLSEAAVSRTAERFGIPIALYAQGNSFDILSKASFPGDGKIMLRDRRVAGQVREAARLAVGFRTVANAVHRVQAKQQGYLTPGTIAASIMRRPEYSDLIVQFALGNQQALSEIFRVGEPKKKASIAKHGVRLVGTWIYDSIMRFPGLLLNSIAAGSYLDINPDSLSQNSAVRNLFKSARYKGPFVDKHEPFWWRPDLDDLLLNAGVKTGNHLVRAKLGGRPSHCMCSVNRKLRAGFYCVLTDQPISEKESEGGLSWFPPGADLARINRHKLDELKPWLARY